MTEKFELEIVKNESILNDQKEVQNVKLQAIKIDLKELIREEFKLFTLKRNNKKQQKN